MITVYLGQRIEAVCKFDYVGPEMLYTFAQEIGTWVGPAGPFNTLARWETKNIKIKEGKGQQQIMAFVLALGTPGLKTGVTYDMNWEIGIGSQDDGTWKFITRKITDDIIQVAEVAFSNLVVEYRKT